MKHTLIQEFLLSHLFYGGFSLGGIIEETLYYPVVIFYEGHREGSEMVWDYPYKQLELERCQLEKFGEEYRDIFKDKDLGTIGVGLIPQSLNNLYI